MKQLTGLDASFLYLESGVQFGHVSGLGVFKRPDTPGWSAYDAVRQKLTRRLPDLEPFRRRLVEVPLRLDHPFWIEDPDFDIEFHVRETAIAAPGTREQLAKLVARLIALPLDRNHPLWECYVIDGLEGDCFGVLTKMHHATVDGAAGAELMTIFYDYEPGQMTVPEHLGLPPGEKVPSPAQMVSKAVMSSIGKPGKFVGLQIRTLRAVGEMTRNRGLTGLAGLLRTIPNPIGNQVAARSRRDDDGPEAPPETNAPATPFNGAITAHRRVALRSVPLDQVKAIKSATGATVNDVVMAACAGGLRRYLLKHDCLPDRPLVAMVPVSIRTGNEADRWTNRVSSLFPIMPTTADDPMDRLRQMQKIMDEAKDRFTLLPASVLVDYADFAPPALAIRAARVASRLRIADRVNPPLNLVVSNVPGPRRTLYLDHAEMLNYYPVSTITDGIGLNITVQSYCDTMDFALVSCRELVPDLDDLADYVIDEFGELALAAGV
ncbi:MAG TPA: wax ester/triacylglycerol synthase family O-acyltransferase [Acidimicrobiales bacterium]|jgi:WS/DGAT/MGAT family acyltransferase|nr:wax ester/triacylglycerol synthase family O-acyltransferase [Acidimicrobiales bacterium]